MPSSHFEYIFYTICLKADISTFPLKQDLKQDISEKKIKNIDFICYYGNRIYLIDVKGLSKLTGDTKVTKDDIQSMKILKEIFGKNAVPLFVYIWVQDKLNLDTKRDQLLQKFRIKAITLAEFEKNMVLQKGWGDKFYRCNKSYVKNIWEYIPKFKDLLEK